MKCPRCRKRSTYLHTDDALPTGGEIGDVSIYCSDCGYIGYTKIKVTEKLDTREFECIDCGNFVKFIYNGRCEKCHHNATQNNKDVNHGKKENEKNKN